MKKGILIGLIMGVVLVLLVIGFFILTKNNDDSNENTDPNQMVNCGMMNNPTCFANRMNELRAGLFYCNSEMRGYLKIEA